MYVSSVFRYNNRNGAFEKHKSLQFTCFLIVGFNYSTVYQMCHDTIHNSNVLNEFNYD